MVDTIGSSARPLIACRPPFQHKPSIRPSPHPPSLVFKHRWARAQVEGGGVFSRKSREWKPFPFLILTKTGCLLRSRDGHSMLVFPFPICWFPAEDRSCRCIFVVNHHLWSFFVPRHHQPTASSNVYWANIDYLPEMFSECLCGTVMTWELSFTFREVERKPRSCVESNTSFCKAYFNHNIDVFSDVQKNWWLSIRLMKHAEENILVWYVSCPFDVGSYILICVSRSLPFSYLSNAPAYFHLDGLMLYQWSCINLVIRVLCLLCGVHVSVWHAAQKDVNASHHRGCLPAQVDVKSRGSTIADPRSTRDIDSIMISVMTEKRKGGAWLTSSKPSISGTRRLFQYYLSHLQHITPVHTMLSRNSVRRHLSGATAWTFDRYENCTTRDRLQGRRRFPSTFTSLWLSQHLRLPSSATCPVLASLHKDIKSLGKCGYRMGNNLWYVIMSAWILV